MSSYTEKIHHFSAKEIDSEQLNNSTSQYLKTIKMTTIATLYEQDHLPSRGLKTMINDFWLFLDKNNTKENTFENLSIVKGDGSPKDKLSELLKMDVVFPYELTKSLLTMSYNPSSNELMTNYYCIAPNISYDIYPIKPNNYSANEFKTAISGNGGNSEVNFKSGFLCLNRSNSIVPVKFDEAGLAGDTRPTGKLFVCGSKWMSLTEIYFNIAYPCVSYF